MNSLNFKKPKNENYCGNIAQVSKTIPLAGCDNIQHADIFGNLVIVSKNVKEGDLGVFFPVECQLSEEFLSANNLYKDSNLNVNTDLKGYFDKSGRVKCCKMRGYESMGLFLGLECLNYLNIDSSLFCKGDQFDFINDKKICNKFVVEYKQQDQANKKSKKDKNVKQKSRLVPGQFNLHIDTPQLGRNIHKITPDSLIQITDKWHGTSLVVSNILTKKPLNLINKIAKYFGVAVEDKVYDIIYSSRQVIKNSNPGSFYGTDVWGRAARQLDRYLSPGMSFYAEIVGYSEGRKLLQKNYDYGCMPGEFKVLIYRITTTTPDGKVFEWSAKQVQDFCADNNLLAVKELYYGYAKDLFPEIEEDNNWNKGFLEALKEKYLEKDCPHCKNKVPAEGVVIRVEGHKLEVFKLKSFRFQQKESKDLDNGEVDTESVN